MKNNGVIIYILTIAILATLTIIFIPKAFFRRCIVYSLLYIFLRDNNTNREDVYKV